MNTFKRIACCTALVASVAAIPFRAYAADDNDKKFLAHAAQADVNEIALSKLALKKGTNPAVKLFAKTMIDEHTKMTESMKPYAQQWGLNPPVGPDQDAKDNLAKLAKLSGKDFDKEYIDIMKSDHTKCFDMFEDEAKDTKDKDFQMAVLQGKTYVAAHKNMAYDLAKGL